MIIEKDDLRKQPTSAMSEGSPPPYRDRENNDNASLSALSYSSSDHGPRKMPPAPPYPESANVQTISKISIHKRRQPISGTYCISSDVPGDDKALSQGGMGNGFSKKLGPRLNWFTTPDASFRTRYGAIYLDLSTGPSTHDVRSTVNVNNRLGNVAIDVSYIDPTNHLNLDAYSRRGNITVLLPRNYCGSVQLSCSTGGYTILPEVANATRIMQGNGGKVFIHIGKNSYLGSDNGSTMDHCRLSAKFGRITLGFSGSSADGCTHKADNLWQRMGSYLRAGSERAGPR
ncbi:hypothetical protein SERLA73DRAFT_184792 [Serpula lacrymans var. lacrymans S7.3]|uniref:DUF7330 domain-containing protein n=2 Tax=Serpula lacrymans var. lacrymans TaxID=341189 RepID=F8Q545_SERL3|nr:uncharacterized protein SERLADRAFT_472914 [Serpula lacrymans var. lacrymans S7.9]EGN96672.1 hypothetical protein SERLA73DRAFT_184792 [Serpula lacrymans var. lacrymans S7.3]EGO22290.1 hypothetical protein SERLADRAFT_472914 [Serpula lacrymans var. lacrymans S7.9]